MKQASSKQNLFNSEIQKIKEIQENLTNSTNKLLNSIIPEIKDSGLFKVIKPYLGINTDSSNLRAIAIINKYWVEGIEKNLRTEIYNEFKNSRKFIPPKFVIEIRNWQNSLDSEELKEIENILNSMILKLQFDFDEYIKISSRKIKLDIVIFVRLAENFDDITAIYELFYPKFREFEDHIKYLNNLGFKFRELNSETINKNWNSENCPIRFLWRASRGEILDWCDLPENFRDFKEFQ